MREWILISVFGRDRPGIVANVSRVLYQSGGNIEELSKTALKGQFAMILIASASPDGSLAGLRDELRSLSQDLDLEINLRKIKEEDMVPFDSGETEPFILTVRGEDRPGLVYGIIALGFETVEFPVSYDWPGVVQTSDTQRPAKILDGVHVFPRLPELSDAVLRLSSFV